MGHITRYRKRPYNGLEVCLLSETKALHTLSFVMPACNALTRCSLKYLSFCRYLFVTSEKWTLQLLLLFQGVMYLQTSILLLPVQVKWKIKTPLLLINDSLSEITCLIILKYIRHSAQKSMVRSTYWSQQGFVIKMCFLK